MVVHTAVSVRVCRVSAGIAYAGASGNLQSQVWRHFCYVGVCVRQDIADFDIVFRTVYVPRLTRYGFRVCSPLRLQNGVCFGFADSRVGVVFVRVFGIG